MKRLQVFLVILVTTFIVACGGGSDGSLLNPAGGGPDKQIATIELRAGSPTLNSSAAGTTEITIQATVKNAGNAVLEGVVVQFTTSSGSVSGIQTTTDINGKAVATLNNGSDPTNRAITVTASAGSVAGSVTVQVTGTTLSITGSPALALGDSSLYTISLLDSQNAGIEASVNVSSANSNTLSATTVQTQVSGQQSVTLTADNSGVETLTVTALGLTATTDVNISGDVFSIQTPVQTQEVNLGVNETIMVLWTKNGVPQAGETITFNADRGTLSSGIAVTDANGEASITISSVSPGLTSITAVNDELTSTSVQIEFIAVTAADLALQANPVTVGVNKQSTISATVRDVNGNAVKNKVVVFVIEQDSTGTSFLSVSAAVTDSQGRATTSYTGGGVPSASNGVVIRATVQDTPAATNTVLLTVTGTAIDMAIGTGDDLFEPTTSLYSKEWAIIVTDTTGTAPEPVANTNVQASIRSVIYFKGSMAINPVPSDHWAPVYSATCPDEDTNRDGFLDLITEDINGNGIMEAGNRATLTAVPPGAADDFCETIGGGLPTTTVLTDNSGIARVCVVYVQSDNLWVQARITSQLVVTGTEYSESQDFLLQALASDLNDVSSSPSGQISPFGVGACTDPF
ncbi:MAG: hypothetical protein DRQ58_10990 [Gammaproteobacteria bacterium]|nr:MAG: hypothetical protein DRQ58_10990 [Gammaproteobacteria bacterium]